MFLLTTEILGCVLPDPEWNDSRTNLSSIILQRYKDGGYKTFVKTKTLTQWQFSFEITDAKETEFLAFYKTQVGKLMQFIWGMEHYEGTLIGDMCQTSRDGRDRVTLTLEFIGNEK